MEQSSPHPDGFFWGGLLETARNPKPNSITANNRPKKLKIARRLLYYFLYF
jgi:hypothetical protein